MKLVAASLSISAWKTSPNLIPQAVSPETTRSFIPANPEIASLSALHGAAQSWIWEPAIQFWLDACNCVQAAAKAADTNKCLTVLPVGGHLGFIAADWTLVKALRLFKNKNPQAALSRSDLDRARQEALDAAKAAAQQFEAPDDKTERKK